MAGIGNEKSRNSGGDYDVNIRAVMKKAWKRDLVGGHARYVSDTSFMIQGKKWSKLELSPLELISDCTRRLLVGFGVHKDSWRIIWSWSW